MRDPAVRSTSLILLPSQYFFNSSNIFKMHPRDSILSSMSLSGQERFQQRGQQYRTPGRGQNEECEDIMIPGASDQKVLDFKPRNGHRHYGNI